MIEVKVKTFSNFCMLWEVRDKFTVVLTPFIIDKRA